MYDGKKIIPGLIVFIVLAVSPFIVGATRGDAATKPDLTLPTQEKQCIEPTDYMRANHMELLISWRDAAVRQGQTTYVASDGKTYEISLTGTCLKCHTDKSQFCDRCHDYSGVTLDCWNCHLDPGESQ